MKRNGANVEFQLYDNVNAANIGAAASIAHNDWVEVLYAQHRARIVDVGQRTAQRVAPPATIRTGTRRTR